MGEEKKVKKEEGKEIIKAEKVEDMEIVTEDEDHAPPVILDLAGDQLVKVVQEAKSRIKAIKEIKQIALNLTSPTDWTDHNGQPYLSEAGCVAIARAFGVTWHDLRHEKVMLEDGHYMYKYYGKFKFMGTEIEAVGARSSKDDFFRVRYDKQGQKIYLPPNEVDEAAVMKAAYTNLLQNGIKRILGIRNITWDDLAQVGINREDVLKVMYRKTGRKSEESKTENKRGESWKDQFVASMKAFRRQLGDKNVDWALEKFGYIAEEDVSNREDAKKIYRALKTLQEGQSEGQGTLFEGGE